MYAIRSYYEKSSIEFREGTVVVDFTVNTDGSIENFKIQNSVAASNDKAVISALKRTSGDWIPGSQNGNPIAMEKRLLVAFNDLNIV